MILAIQLIREDGTPLLTIDMKGIGIDENQEIIAAAMRIAKSMLSSFSGKEQESVKLESGDVIIEMREIRKKFILVVIVSNPDPIDAIKVEHIRSILEVRDLNKSTAEMIAEMSSKNSRIYPFYAWGETW
ncbi:MAG: hypothetical protein ACTSR0_06455 [Candidatus Asgardarchaeia archaeon]